MLNVQRELALVSSLSCTPQAGFRCSQMILKLCLYKQNYSRNEIFHCYQYYLFCVQTERAWLFVPLHLKQLWAAIVVRLNVCLCWEVSQHLDFNQRDPDLTNLEALLHFLMPAAIKICSNINLLNKRHATLSQSAVPPPPWATLDRSWRRLGSSVYSRNDSWPCCASPAFL